MVDSRTDRGTAGVGALAVDAFGILLMFGGAVVCGISFVQAPWYRVTAVADSPGGDLEFADLHANADSLSAPVAGAYFDRFAWGLVGLVVLIGLVARVVRVGSAPLRLLAFLVAVVGIVGTYYAMAQLFNAQRIAGGSSQGVLSNASYGLYLAFGGYALLALGAVLGHRPALTRSTT